MALFREFWAVKLVFQEIVPQYGSILPTLKESSSAFFLLPTLLRPKILNLQHFFEISLGVNGSVRGQNWDTVLSVLLQNGRDSIRHEMDRILSIFWMTDTNRPISSSV